MMELRMPPLAPSKDVAQYPLFTSGVSRWIWRIYAQRLTAAGRWFLLATALFSLYGGISLSLQGYVPSGYTAVIWTVAAGAMLVYRPKVSLTARLPERVCAGETIQADIDIVQLGHLRGADLAVMPHRLPMAIDAIPEDGILLPDLKKRERTRIRIGLKCTARGAFAARISR